MTHFFSCDWGTTSFRLRRVSVDTGDVLEERREASGVRSLFSGAPAGDRSAREQVFADFLRAQLRRMSEPDIASLDQVQVIISGMASSSVGWRELPYAQAPLVLGPSSLVRESFALEIDDQCLAQIHLVSGVRTENDVMRGEETEILGLLASGRHSRIGNDGVVVLPGTHSKHVRLQKQQLTGFQTFMTGELFDVLSTHSLLRASVQSTEDASGVTSSKAASRDAFIAGVRRAASAGLAESLFQTRVRTVLQGVSPGVNRWFLSGLLIGSEVERFSVGETGLPILLAAPESLSARYQLAFETLGFGDRLTVAPPAEVALASVRGHRELLVSFVDRAA